MPRIVPLLAFAILCSSLAHAAEQVGQVRNASGSIAVRHETDRDFQDVDFSGLDAAPAFNLDAWRTGSESTCEVYLANGTILVLLPETVVVVRMDANRQIQSIELLDGSVKVVSVNSPDYQTNVLTPSAFVTQRGGIFVARVESEGELQVQGEQGELAVVHNYGTMIVLPEGQGLALATDFSPGRRVFLVTTPPENTEPVVARIFDRVALTYPPGNSASIENRLVPGQGGEIVIEASLDNGSLVSIALGEPEAPDQTHGTQPGERVIIRFERDIDTEIEVQVGDLTPRSIPRAEPDDPYDLPGDIVPPEIVVPQLIPNNPASPVE